MSDKKVTYELLESEKMNFGNNKFLEIGKKRIVETNTVIVSISKGYYSKGGKTIYYPGGVGFPYNDQKLTEIILKLQKLRD